MILGQIELLSETMTLADKAGVGAANVSGSVFDSAPALSDFCFSYILSFMTLSKVSSRGDVISNDTSTKHPNSVELFPVNSP